MSCSPSAAQNIDEALSEWRQGDIALNTGMGFLQVANLKLPHSPISEQVAKSLEDAGEELNEDPIGIWDDVPGFVIVSQTCDILRSCMQRPYVEIAPLMRVESDQIEIIRRLKRPAYAYIPHIANQQLVADLDRTMTIEKAILAKWERVPGWSTDDEGRAFALALSRKLARFAFPDDFVRCASQLQRRLIEKHSRQSDEGSHLRSLDEIRVRAAPSWNEREVHLDWWFIKAVDPEGIEVDWVKWIETWMKLFDHAGRFRSNPAIACQLEDMTARDYVESDRLDLDSLSSSREAST